MGIESPPKEADCFRAASPTKLFPALRREGVLTGGAVPEDSLQSGDPAAGGAPYKYSAFISYKRDPDLRTAAALHSALHRIAKPWYRLRAMRVFRDKTDLATSDQLWSSIQRALMQSARMILLAAPASAASPWVQRELRYWIESRSADDLLLVLTDGQIVWDNRAGDFDWSRTDALPTVLRGVYKEEPLYVDLRFARNTQSLSLRHPDFKDATAQIAAHIQGREKSDLIGEDVRQYRKTIRLVWSTIAVLLILTLAAAIAAWSAYQQRNIAEARRRDAEAQRNEADRQKGIAQNQTRIAEQAAAEEKKARQAEERQRLIAEQRRVEAVRQRDLAFARQLASQAELLRSQHPALLPRSVLIAIEALKRSPSLQAVQTLRHGLALLAPPSVRLGHADSVNALAFSPDGRFLATADSSGSAQVFELPTGRRIQSFKLDRREPPAAFDVVNESVRFSPDGRWLATASPFTVQVWEAASGRELARLSQGREVHSLAFSPDGSWLATASGDGTARMIDTSTWRELKRLPHQGSASVDAVAFSPGGRYLATTDSTRILRLWDTAAGQEIARFQHAGTWPVALSREGKQLALVSSSVIELREAIKGREIARLRFEPRASPVIFGRYLGADDSDGLVRVWETGSGAVLARLPHEDYVVAAAFSPDSRHLAAAGRNGVGRVWDIAAEIEVARMVHEDALTAMAYSPDGRYLATAGKDRFAVVWEADGSQDAVRSVPYDGSKYSAASSLDGRYLAAPSVDGVAVLWDLAGDVVEKRLRHGNSVQAVAFSPDGKRLATAGSEGMIRLWETHEGREISQLASNEGLTGLALSPGARYLATLDQYGAVRVWDAADGREVTRLPRERPVMDLAFGPDGKYLVTAGQDSLVRIWEDWHAPLPREVMRLPFDAAALTVAFSQDGRYLAAGGVDGQARVLELPTRREVMRTRHEGGIVKVALNSNGTYLATAGREGTARIFGRSEQREMLRLSLDGELQTVAFVSNGRHLATTGSDHVVRVWHWRQDDLIGEGCARLARNLTLAEWRQYVGDVPYRKICSGLP